MADKIEIRLDDVIKSNNRCCGDGDGDRGRREWQYQQRRNIYKYVAPDGVQKGRGRGGITKSYRRGYVNSGWKHNPSKWYTPRKISGSRTMAEDNSGHAKLIISNLDFGVSYLDLLELFEEFRPLKSTVHYDRSGMSLGSADVIFERRSEAIRAMNQYNRICLDGRPMNIQLTTSEFPSLVRNTTVRVGKTFEYGSPRGAQKTRNTMGRPAERERNPRNQKKPPTAKELDAELEAYAKERKKIQSRSKIF